MSLRPWESAGIQSRNCPATERVGFEQTIRSAIEFTGVGLHSGAPVRMRILPAAAGTGIVFRRVDLDGFMVEAIGRNVAKVSYATSLMKKGVLISTTEHLLSAFLGLGLDNAIVELDSLELPILDGSALPIVQAVLGAGLRKQRRQRVYMCILREVEVRDGAKSITVYPADSYRVHYRIDFPHPLVGLQEFTVELSNGSYQRQIASARTFGFLRDEAVLRNMGLIRGASEANAIVLTDDGIKNPPLRYRGRVRAPQGARSDWRPRLARASAAGTHRSRPRRTRHARRAGFPAAARPLLVGAGHAAGGRA